MSVDILIASLRSWEMMRFRCLSHLVRLWSFITAALVAPQHPRNSSQERPERPTLPARVEQATLRAVGCSEKHQGKGQPARGDQWCSCGEVQPRSEESGRGKMGLPWWSRG